MKRSEPKSGYLWVVVIGSLLFCAAPVFAEDPAQSDPINYQEIVKVLKEPWETESLCYYGRDEMLVRLDKLRAEHPEYFENIDYGPIALAKHKGIVIYTRGEGQSYDQAVEGGQVWEYTNFYSDDTGKFKNRPWSKWKEGYWGLWGKHGERDEFGGMGSGYQHLESYDQGSLKFGNWYWNKDGPKYPVPVNKIYYSAKPRADHTFTGRAGSSLDPNEKTGPQGYDDQHWVRADERFHYTVYFENIGSAPAQIVTVQDFIDVEKLDLATFKLEQIQFGDTIVSVPGDASEFETLVDLRPGRPLLVRIQAAHDEQGTVSWQFSAIDPLTWQLPEYDGFLPPNTIPPNGQGSVSYSIAPKDGLPDGTVVGRRDIDDEYYYFRADIVFDQNPSITTNGWANSIDSVAPESWVTSLGPVQQTENFTVNWDGDDGSSGIKDYSVFVSVNGGEYIPWLENVSETSDVFPGKNGNSYGFCSVARDNVGNPEQAPGAPDMVTKVTLMLPGDLDGDRDVDKNDINKLLTYRNQSANNCPDCDIDGDGTITVLDARKLTLMCTRARCATQ